MPRHVPRGADGVRAAAGGPAFVDAVLVGRAQLGDLRALDRLLAAVQAPLYRHVAQLVGDPHLAEDVLQDVLLTIARKLGTLRDPRWFRAWAYRVATRAALRRARGARRLPALVDPADLADLAEVPAEPDPPAFDPDLVAVLERALDAVPPASQLVLRMHYLDGLTHVEVAEALDLSVGTVKSRLAYGLAWLRKVLPRATR